MRGQRGWFVAASLGVCACLGPAVVEAADPEVAITVAPVRQIFVDGDEGKFRELHWTKTGYLGGISDFSARHGFANGIELQATGHALINQNDLGAGLRLEKEGLGFVNVDFTEFRKYFDNNGGVYHLFQVLNAPQTDHDLRLDIGKLSVETGLTLEGLPDVTLLYERRYKDGSKTKLNWGEAEETPPTGNATRNIVPTWYQMDEVVDTFAVGLSDDIAGVAVSGEQRWEWLNAETLRNELDMSTTHGSGDDIVHQDERGPKSSRMTTTWKAERGFQDDRVRVASAYRYAQLENEEFLSVKAFNTLTGAPTSSGHNHPDSWGFNHYSSHTWATNLMTTPMEHLTVVTQLKTELVGQDGYSTFRVDDDGNGLENSRDWSWSDHKDRRWGEGLSIR